MRLIDADKMCADLATVDPRYEQMIEWCITVTKAQPTMMLSRLSDVRTASIVNMYRKMMSTAVAN